MNYLKTPWTSQPQQAVGVDWSNPITRGLEAVFTFTPSGATDLVSGKFYPSSNLTQKATSRGVGVTHANATGIDLPGLLQKTSDFSRVVVCTPQVASFGTLSDGKITGFGGAQLQIGTTSVEFNRANEQNYLTISIPNRPFVVAVSAGSNYQSGFVDGVLKAERSGTLTFSNTGTGRLFAAGPGSVDYDGTMLLHISYLRAISNAEAASLSQNPWQIFKPLPRRIFVPVSATTGNATGTGSFYDVTLSSPTGTASGTGASNGTGTGSLSAVSTTAPSAAATGSALATGALTAVTLTTITASATGSALATGSLDAIDLSTVSGSATGTTAGNAEGVGSVATIALSAPSASAVGSALATGSFAHISLSAVSGTASAATNGQATADLHPISISAPLAIAIASSVATGGIQSIGLTAPNASASGQAQTIARPGSDTSNTGWTPSTGSDLYAMLDEVTPDDADYISTTSAGSVCRLGLGAVADPGTSSGQVVSYRASSSTGNGLLVELMQGGTVIATWNHATLPATDTTYQQSLSAAECDAITDYTALSVRLTSL